MYITYVRSSFVGVYVTSLCLFVVISHQVVQEGFSFMLDPEMSFTGLGFTYDHMVNVFGLQDWHSHLVKNDRKETTCVYVRTYDTMQPPSFLLSLLLLTYVVGKKHVCIQL